MIFFLSLHFLFHLSFFSLSFLPPYQTTRDLVCNSVSRTICTARETSRGKVKGRFSLVEPSWFRVWTSQGFRVRVPALAVPLKRPLFYAGSARVWNTASFAHRTDNSPTKKHGSVLLVYSRHAFRDFLFISVTVDNDKLQFNATRNEGDRSRIAVVLDSVRFWSDCLCTVIYNLRTDISEVRHIS